MIKLTIVSRSGDACVFDAATGQSLMEAIRSAGSGELAAICGGCCSCATCHVHLTPEWMAKLPPVDEDEEDLLQSSSHYDGTSRLSCQVMLTSELDGLIARIAEED